MTSVLQDPEGLKLSIHELMKCLEGTEFDVIAGAEARGFLFGMPLAYNKSKAFVPIRKKGKLPRETISEEYSLEYGTETIEMHKDAIFRDRESFLSMICWRREERRPAAIRMIERLGGKVVKVLFLMELAGLEGRKELEGYDVDSVIIYPGK